MGIKISLQLMRLNPQISISRVNRLIQYLLDLLLRKIQMPEHIRPPIWRIILVQ
jgi:hypothetical protein